jgi:hypothetical protein
MEDINALFQQLNTSLIEVKMFLATGDVLNAFYSALILKKMSGVEITLDLEAEVMIDVFSKYKVFSDRVVEGYTLSKQPGKSWQPT